MLTSRDMAILLELVSRGIEREGVEREQDRERDSRRFYRLVDLRNRLVVGFRSVHCETHCSAVYKEAAPLVGQPPVTFGWN